MEGKRKIKGPPAKTAWEGGGDGVPALLSLFLRLGLAGGREGTEGIWAQAQAHPHSSPPPAPTPHRQVHFQPRWPVIQRLNITNEALNGTRGLS